MRILIHAIPGDMHAAAVAAVLSRFNVQLLFSVEVLATSGQFYSYRVEPDAEERTIYLDKEKFELGRGIDVVWCRRRGRFDTSMLHPDDVEFVSREFRSFLDGFWEGAAQDSVWINPWQARKLSDTKIKQLSAAHALGFPLSPTLISNDPEEIRAFVQRFGIGNVIFKTIVPAVWEEAGGTIMYTNTSLVTEDLLASPADLCLCPGIYQVRIKKAAELRVTVMGDRIYCAEVVAGSVTGAEIDWRIGQHDMQVRPFDLPRSVAEMCCNLVSRLGLVFGCLDLILGEDGVYYFLEVNEMGQFLWVEKCCPDLRYLEAFIQFLFRMAGSEVVPDGFSLSEIEASQDYRDMMGRISGSLEMESA